MSNDPPSAERIMDVAPLHFFILQAMNLACRK